MYENANTRLSCRKAHPDALALGGCQVAQRNSIYHLSPLS